MSVPTTYSFSLEMDNYYFNSMTPLAENETLWIVSSDKGTLLYTICGVGCTKSETDKYYHSSLKAQLYGDQGIQEASLTLFAPLTAFLTKLETRLAKPVGQKDYWTFKDVQGNKYSAVYVSATPSIPMKQETALPLAQTPLLPTFSFGLDSPSILEPFYHHFDPVKVLDLNREQAGQPEKAMFDRDPYSGRSKALFSVMMEPLGMTSEWSEFFSVLEFARLSFGLAMAREINQEDTNARGNEAYMRILSRTTLRSLFQNIIPPVLLKEEYTYRDPYASEAEVVKVINPFKELVRYIHLCFTEPFQKRIPFWHLSTTGAIGGKRYVSADASVGNPDLAQYYRDKANVENILASMILKDWDTQGYPDELKKAVLAVFGKSPSQGVAAIVNTMTDNMGTYDLMSPVPFALPVSGMGDVTRNAGGGGAGAGATAGAVAGMTKFMLDVTYVKTLYEKTAGQAGAQEGFKSVSCVYDNAFMSWCISEMNQARQNWATVQSDEAVGR